MVVTRSSSTASRRSRRSVRTLAAVVLLLTALVAGVTAIAVASTGALVAAVVYIVAAASVAARLLSNETADVRRDWARDRAAIAHEHSRASTKRSREQVTFAETMAQRVRAAEAEVRRLDLALAESEAATEDALGLHADERRRATELEARLAADHQALLEARTELRQLRDALAESQSVEVELRAELLAWQQGDETRRYA